jgi:AcrR family transcriptional regulator
VARAAGVARSLVHHYFGGIRELYLAVIAQGGAALVDVRRAGPEVPLDERLARNVTASLDVVEKNRETWLAVVVHGGSLDDEGIRALVAAATERNIDRMLAVNSDVVKDTPSSRYALRCFSAFATAATREWIAGERTREETERLLVTAFRDMLMHTIPAFEAGAKPNRR